MQTEDFQKFHECIAGVMSFYEKSVSAFALDMWWTALKGHDLAPVIDAFRDFRIGGAGVRSVKLDLMRNLAPLGLQEDAAAACYQPQAPAIQRSCLWDTKLQGPGSAR